MLLVLNKQQSTKTISISHRSVLAAYFKVNERMCIETFICLQNADVKSLVAEVASLKKRVAENEKEIAQLKSDVKELKGR